MMKKILALMLSVSMIAGLAACGSKETEAPATDAPATEAPRQAETTQRQMLLQHRLLKAESMYLCSSLPVTSSVI